MKMKLISWLQQLKRPYLWLLSVLLSVILSEIVTSLTEFSLTGTITGDYLLTSFITSIFVSSLVVGLVGTFLDYLNKLQKSNKALKINIAERNRVNQQKKKIISLLQATLESTKDAILVVDLNNTWVLHNQQFLKLWNIPNEIIDSKDDGIALAYVLDQLEEAETFLEKVYSLYSAPEMNSCDILNFKNGKIIERYSIPQRVDGKVIGRVWSFRDITDHEFAKQCIKNESEKNLALLHNASDGIHILDTNGNIIEVSDSFCNMLGYSRNEIIGMNISQLDEKFTREELVQVLKDQFTNSFRSQFETRHRRKNGTSFPVEISNFPLKLDNKAVLFNSSRDITDRKLAEDKLHLAASVFTHANEAIIITDPDGAIIDVNNAFSQITGYNREEVIGRKLNTLSADPQEEEFYKSLWQNLTENGYWQGETWNRRKNGEKYVEQLTISSARDGQSNIRHYVVLFSDITAQKEHEQQLEKIAHYDSLTCLPNRVLLADRLHQGMIQAERQAQRLAVVYLDLDGFKEINDVHGHDAGDQILIKIAARMKNALREGDTLARLGGDEFVAVLLNTGDIDGSVSLITRILEAVAMPIKISDYVLHVSASIGVTFYPQAENVDADLLLRQADQAMYQAKLTGKNRYQVFDAKQANHIRTHHESLKHIQVAFDRNEFVLYYQPKVNMRSGEIIGVEALIRWQHPEKGLLAPSMFLPIIENHTLAIDIGEWVINTALTQIEQWHIAGLDMPVSINIGALQLQHAGFFDTLSKALISHSNVSPSKIELEILETSALEDMSHVSKIIKNCQPLGITFALDDFGTGYSSLTYLKHLPVSQLKIDQSFVRDMLEDPDDLAIVEGVLGLAKAFRREVIAEGVESVEHGKMLLQLGCDFAQGYGISRPMPADQIQNWCKDWHTNPVWAKLSK